MLDALEEALATGHANVPKPSPPSTGHSVADDNPTAATLVGAPARRSPRMSPRAAIAGALRGRAMPPWAAAGGVRRRTAQPRAALVGAVLAAVALGAVAALLANPFGGDGAPSAQRPGAAARAAERLDIRRVPLRDELAAARTPARQAAVARDLARAYSDAATTAGTGALASAAGRASAAYRELAAAAEGHGAARYAAASDAVRGAERAVAAARRR
jgi:hypothetical protein